MVKPPEGKVDWNVVDGLEECRDPDGGAVEPLVAMNKYIVSPKETQCNLLGNVLLASVSCGPVVNGQVAHQGAFGIVKFPG